MTGRPTGAIVVLAALANLGPCITALQRGQTALLLGALLVEALWWLAQKREFACGFLIGVAAGLKIYPALLAAPLVMQRRWRGLAGFAAALLILWLALPVLLMGPGPGWSSLRAWLTQILLPFLGDAHFAQKAVFTEFNQFALANQSFFAVLARWLARDALPTDEPFVGTLANLTIDQVRLIAAGLSAVLLVVIAGVAWRLQPGEVRGKRADYRFQDAALWSLMMVAAICISHVGWNHYYVGLTLTYALAGVVIGQTPRRSTKWRTIATLLALAIAGNWLHLALPVVRQSGAMLVTSLALALVLTFVRLPGQGATPATQMSQLGTYESAAGPA